VVPANASEWIADPRTYSWTSAGDGAQYRLVVVEVTATQTPTAALATNTPVLDATVSSLDHAPGAGAPPLEPGKAYAWHVVATLESVSVASAPAWFRRVVAGETVSRTAAIATLLQRHVVPPTLERAVTAYLSRSPLPAGAQVAPWDEPGAAHVVAAPSWFAWIDDEPQAFFAHPTRFVLIDVVTGAVTVLPSEWWPVVDGASLWNDDEAWRDNDVLVYSERHRRE
jgi:hypothetical protein